MQLQIQRSFCMCFLLLVVCMPLHSGLVKDKEGTQSEAQIILESPERGALTGEKVPLDKINQYLVTASEAYWTCESKEWQLDEFKIFGLDKYFLMNTALLESLNTLTSTASTFIVDERLWNQMNANHHELFLALIRSARQPEKAQAVIEIVGEKFPERLVALSPAAVILHFACIAKNRKVADAYYEYLNRNIKYANEEVCQKLRDLLKPVMTKYRSLKNSN